MVTILRKLHGKGLLVDGTVPEETDDALRHSLHQSSTEYASRRTPFGQLVQTLELPGNTSWSYLHPFAMIFLLTQLQPAFAAIIDKCLQDAVGGALKVVIFIDEFRPGNALRPDKARATQNLYWTFAELPAWLLCRTEAWMQLGSLRSGLMGDIGLSISGLMRRVLGIFWGTAAPEHFLTHSGTLFVATFAGFLGDEKGLKEVFSAKGPAGTRPCLSCVNVVQFMEHDDTIVGIDAPRSRIVAACDADVWRAADRVKHLAATGQKKELELVQQASGLTYDKDGILYDDSLRDIVKPVSGWFRDWMHVLCVSGVANTELQQMLAALKTEGINLATVSEFFGQCVLPRQEGRVHSEWFTVKRIGTRAEAKDGWKGFAGELMTIVPILALFLELAVVPQGVLQDHCRCFFLLNQLMQVMSLGADTAVAHAGLIERIIDQHHALFRRLYPHVIKPKLHALFHIGHHIRNLQKLLSCWVTERKHRISKAFASRTFRNYEATLANDIANRVAVMFVDGSMFERESLTGAKPHDFMGVSYKMSGEAHLLCGAVRVGELVLLADGTAGFVQSFSSGDDDGAITAVIKMHSRVGDFTFAKLSSSTAFVDSSSILSPCVYCFHRGNLRIVPPAPTALH